MPLPEGAQASLPAEQCIGREFPSENAFLCHAAQNVAPERWSGPNPPQTCRTQAKGCPRRGIALPPCAQERLSSGPCCTQFPNWLVTSSMVRKDSPEERVEKLRNAVNSLSGEKFSQKRD